MPIIETEMFVIFSLYLTQSCLVTDMPVPHIYFLSNNTHELTLGSTELLDSIWTQHAEIDLGHIQVSSEVVNRHYHPPQHLGTVLNNTSLCILKSIVCLDVHISRVLLPGHGSCLIYLLLACRLIMST